MDLKDDLLYLMWCSCQILPHTDELLLARDANRASLGISSKRRAEITHFSLSRIAHARRALLLMWTNCILFRDSYRDFKTSRGVFRRKSGVTPSHSRALETFVEDYYEGILSFLRGKSIFSVLLLHGRMYVDRII